MCFGGPTVDDSYQKFAQAEARRARREETARQGRIQQGMGNIANVFGNMGDVLEQRENAMRGFYEPQMQQQFDRAGEDLTFALARAGQLTSTTAGQRQGDLSQQFALNRAAMESDIGADLANTQQRMNQQRAQLESGLRASGDATAATDAALNSAVTFRQDVPQISPLGHLFYGVGQGIGAINQGYQTGRIRQMATPNPLSGGTGRVVR
jgi:hypothetical protein